MTQHGTGAIRWERWVKTWLLHGDVPDVGLLCHLLAVYETRLCGVCLQAGRCWRGRELQSPGWVGPDAGHFQLSEGTGNAIWGGRTATCRCCVFPCMPCDLVSFQGLEVFSERRSWVCWSVSCSSLSLASGNKRVDASKLVTAYT